MFNTVEKEIFEFRDRMLNRCIQASFIIALIATGFSVARYLRTGFHPFYLVQVGNIILYGLLVVFHRKLSYYQKFYASIALILTASAAAMLGLGALGHGNFYIIVAMVMASIFSNKRITLGVIAASMMLILLFMLLYCTGILSTHIDAVKYNGAVISWLNVITTNLLFSSIIAVVAIGLIGKLEEMVAYSLQQSEELKKFNESLEETVRLRTVELVQSNKEKDRILGVVAHDVNNRIGGISLILELIRVKHLVDQESTTAMMEMAEKSCKCTIEIIRELLELSKNQLSDAELYLESVEMESFIRLAIELHQPQAIAKQIVLSIAVSDAGVHCPISRTKFSRVIDNLLTNAIKFTPAGGRVFVEIIKETETALVKICDSGIGIPDSIKDLIFVPFSNSGRTGTASEESTGLGLSIVKGIVEKHGGSTWFETVAGVGTTFFVRIPRQD